MDGAILQMINHGLITGALFLLVGVIYERTHDRTIAKMGGLAALTPVWAVDVRLLRVRVGGAARACPASSGEFLALVGTFVVNPWAAAVATFVMILAAAYLLWMFQRVVLGEPSAFLLGLKHHLTDMTADRDPDPGAARRDGRRVRAVPGRPARPDRRPGRRSRSRPSTAGDAITVDPLLVVLGLGIVVAIVAARLVAVDRAARATTRAVERADRRGRRTDDPERRHRASGRSSPPSLVAIAVLVVDLVAPGRRSPALVVSLGGLAIVAALTIATGAFIADDPTGRVDRVRRRVRRRRPDDVPGPAVHRDRGVHDRVRAGLPRAARPAARRVLGRPAVRDDRRDAHRRLGGPARSCSSPSSSWSCPATCSRATTRPTATRPRARSSTSSSARSAPRSSCSAWRSRGAPRARRASPASGRRSRRSPPGRAACRRRSILGLGFMTTGVAFKIAAVPFHYWTPDAYQGSPTPVTGYLSVGPKVGAFALILRLFVEALGPLRTDWLPVVDRPRGPDDDAGQPRRADPEQRQADARVLVDRPYRVHARRARGVRRGRDPGPAGPPVLRRRVRVHEPRRVRRGRGGPAARRA